MHEILNRKRNLGGILSYLDGILSSGILSSGILSVPRNTILVVSDIFENNFINSANIKQIFDWKLFKRC